MNQGEKCAEGGAFVPMIEDGTERCLAFEKGNTSTQDDRHPKQGFEASSEADAAERRKGSEKRNAHGKARYDPRRAQGSRYVRRLRQDANLSDWLN